MNKSHNSSLKINSQKLRKNMTKEERHLWYDFLKDLPVTVKRQQIVYKYIVDFYCASAGIVIELDGSQHFKEEGLQSDRERDNYFQSRGIEVLRYSNNQINTQFSSVCEDIWQHIFGK